MGRLSPKGDSHGQSNGEAERSVQTVQGLVRTLTAGLEEKGITIDPTSAVLAWMVEYPSTLHTLFSQESHEGMTPFQRIKGRRWQVALPCFGEAIDCRCTTRCKLDARWQAGVFLGIRLQSTVWYGNRTLERLEFFLPWIEENFVPSYMGYCQ